MTSGIYQIVNSATGKAYVGSALDLRKRKNSHWHALRNGGHHSSKLQRAWLKYGREAFTFQTLFICAKELLTFYEQRALEVLAPEYNVLREARSSLGYKHTAETREKMRAIQGQRTVQPAAGRTVSDEEKRRISVANTGRVCSEATHEKLRAARVGRKPAEGMRHTPEARAKMSADRKGKPRPLAAVEASAAKRRGTHHDEAAKAKISAALKGRKKEPEITARMVATKLANKLLKLRAAESAQPNALLKAKGQTNA